MVISRVEWFQNLLIIPRTFFISNSRIRSGQLILSKLTQELNFDENPTHFSRNWIFPFFKRFEIIFSTSYSITINHDKFQRKTELKMSNTAESFRLDILYRLFTIDGVMYEHLAHNFKLYYCHLRTLLMNVA